LARVPPAAGTSLAARRISLFPNALSVVARQASSRALSWAEARVPQGQARGIQEGRAAGVEASVSNPGQGAAQQAMSPFAPRQGVLSRSERRLRAVCGRV